MTRPKREHGRDRAERVVAEARRKIKKGEVYARRTRRGEVNIARVELIDTPEAVGVEVWLAGATESGDPHFRIFSPPTLVADPEGDVVLEGRGRYREDPLAAIAEVVAVHGGRAVKGRRR